MYRVKPFKRIEVKQIWTVSALGVLLSLSHNQFVLSQLAQNVSRLRESFLTRYGRKLQGVLYQLGNVLCNLSLVRSYTHLLSVPALRKVELKFRKKMDQFSFLWHYPPTPPLTHVSAFTSHVSEKHGLGVGWAGNFPKPKLIQKIARV